MTLQPVETRRDLRDFLVLTDQLYAGEPRYIPPLHAQVRAWWKGGVRLSVLRRRGQVVARTTLHTDAALDARLGRATQLFGLTEFAEDAAGELFDGIQAAAREGGRQAVFGPVSLLPNQAGGVITSGFEERGFIDSAWNRPSYPAAYEGYGFTRRFESDTWICPVPGEPVFAFDDARIEAERLRVHRGDRRRFREQLPILRELLNASFAQLGYYTQISADQLAAQTDGLSHLLDEALLLYLTKADRPIAFVLCLPDISRSWRTPAATCTRSTSSACWRPGPGTGARPCSSSRARSPASRGAATCGCSPASCTRGCAAAATTRCAAPMSSGSTPDRPPSTSRWAGARCTATPSTART